MTGPPGRGDFAGFAGASAPRPGGSRGAVLGRAFFRRAVTEVAPELLGCVISHQTPEGLVAGRIMEVEAYAGEVDPASHAFRGKTARNEVMFGEPGHAYVYFTYGMHFCVNLVCQPAGLAAAVLLRAAEIVGGAELAGARRGGGGPRDLARGPARLCQALGIDRRMNGADVCDPGSPLLAFEAEPGAARGAIATGPRIGVRQGAETPWRYWIDNNDFVSNYRGYAPKRRGRTVNESGIMHQ